MEESVEFDRHENMFLLCDRLGIGKPSEPLHRVTGGLMHRMYKMNTSKGVFAVKVLNAEVMTRAGVWDNYRLSEKISRAAFQAGLPSVPALTVDGEPLLYIDGLHFMVFQWIKGSMLPSTPAKPEHCGIMGRLLARIHALKLDFSMVKITSEVADFNWKSLLNRGREIAAPWAEADSTLLELHEWTSAYEAAHDALNRHLVFSHRDLDQKNVLWMDEVSPALIDWEAAGPINPVQELVSTALDWAGVQAGAVNRDAFMAFINGYLDRGGTVMTEWRAAINGGLIGQLQWLAYNMRRSLGEALSEPEDQEVGTRESVRTLMSLREITRNREVWCEWLEG
ncbi:phosphotransferase [Paenibacillus baekrokdamisoli]|nr:phosphotransferase [Paenibacillus baekrokdamisoli]